MGVNKRHRHQTHHHAQITKQLHCLQTTIQIFAHFKDGFGVLALQSLHSDAVVESLQIDTRWLQLMDYVREKHALIVDHFMHETTVTQLLQQIVHTVVGWGYFQFDG